MSEPAAFTALPVGQGDAFLLWRQGRTILVDGGKAEAGLDVLLRREGRDWLDVVVCTHNDADHANGVIGLFRSAFPVGEVWLPGRWNGVLPAALLPFAEVAEGLLTAVVDEVRRLDVDEISEELLFESWTDRRRDLPDDDIVADGDRTDTPRDEDATDGWTPALAERIERAEDWPHPMLFRAARFVDQWPWRPPHWILREIDRGFDFRHYHAALALFDGALEAAHRIREIAREAYHADAAVRWFAHSRGGADDGTDWLKCLSARQQLRVRVPRARVSWESVFRLLSLSVANRESLVFASPADEAEGFPGVLFSADSDLRDVPLKIVRPGFIVTAPHHGSERNGRAYEKLDQQVEPSSLTWVRSDGRFRSRPGRSYTASHRRRYCTLCRASGQPKQAIRLEAAGGHWVPAPATRSCSCTVIGGYGAP